LENKGEVRQRARKFQSADSPGPSPARAPGRINLDRWEQRCRDKTSGEQALPRSLQEATPPTDRLDSLTTITEEARPQAAEDVKEEIGRTDRSLVFAQSPAPWELDATFHDADTSALNEEMMEPHGVPENKGRDAECFDMWDSEDDRQCRKRSDELPLGRCWAETELEEPLEFSMLDYLADLPEGVAEKLRICLKTHEELVRRLCQRSERLRVQVRHIQCDGCETGKSSPFSPMARQSPKATKALPLHGNAGRAEMGKSDARADFSSTDCARARDEHEIIEANLKSRLQRTIKASKERVQAMQRRVEREEQQVRTRFEAAMQTREGLERSIKAALKEQSWAKLRICELEEVIARDATRCRVKEKEREQLLEKQSSIRNELKAERIRASKHRHCERRIQDLQRELEALTKACHTESPRWAL